MAATISNLLVTGPTSPGGAGALSFTATAPGNLDVYLVSTAPPGPGFTPVSEERLNVPPGNFSFPGLYPHPYNIIVYLAGGIDPVTVGATVPAYLPPPVATATPPAIAAAHLPMLLVLEAAPTGTPLAASALLLVVEVYRGAWVEVGRLRGVCDATTGLARFDLSEYLKTQFSPTPPDESGGYDPALAIGYRVRYGRAADFDGTAGDEAGTFEGLAVNAAEVVNPAGAPLPLALGPAAPYASVPAGFARFRSTLDAAGIKNRATVPVVASTCAFRQFVWLHPSGAWAWGLFGGRHVHGVELTDDVVVRRAKGEDYYVGGGDTRDTLQVYSDRISWPEFLVLRTIRKSRRVYERLPSGLYVPVLLERGTFPEYKETDKLFAVDFTARYPVQPVQTF